MSEKIFVVIEAPSDATTAWFKPLSEIVRFMDEEAIEKLKNRMAGSLFLYDNESRTIHACRNFAVELSEELSNYKVVTVSKNDSWEFAMYVLLLTFNAMNVSDDFKSLVEHQKHMAYEIACNYEAVELKVIIPETTEKPSNWFDCLHEELYGTFFGYFMDHNEDHKRLSSIKNKEFEQTNIVKKDVKPEGNLGKDLENILEKHSQNISSKDSESVDSAKHLSDDNTNTDPNVSVKNDRKDHKIRWDLIPMDAINEIAKVYTAGADKYGENRWQNLKNGLERYRGAAFRHLFAYMQGSRYDEETKCMHLAQCAWNVIAMLWLDMHDKGKFPFVSIDDSGFLNLSDLDKTDGSPFDKLMEFVKKESKLKGDETVRMLEYATRFVRDSYPVQATGNISPE